MKKEETLQRIKDAERQVRGSKESVLAERERILRDARREAFELRETLRKQAEARHEEILRAAEAATSKETERVLAGGRKDAAALKARAEANMDRAIERLVEKFKGAINA